MPAAECGITMGKSIIPKTTFFKGKLWRASRYDNGIAIKENESVAAIDTPSVSQMLD